MKKIFQISLVIALMIITYSCSRQLEPVPQFTKSTSEFSATASTSSVAASSADSLKSVISFNWNDPKYSVGLKSSKFTVVMGNTGKNFVSSLSKEFTGVLTGAMVGKEINGMALRLGGIVGQPIILDVKVIASQSNNNEPKSSAILPITVTPYGDLGLTSNPTSITPSAATPDAIGATFSWNVAFNGFSGVKTYAIQYAKAGTSFATPVVNSVSGFSKSFTHLQLNDIALGYGIAPSVAGNVEFRLKATNELGVVIYSNTVALSITPYVAINSVGVIGDATPGGWNTDTDLYRPDAANKPTEWTTIVYLIGGKAAKFRTDDDWAINWGDVGFPSGTGTKGGSNIPVNTSGYYRVDFNAATAAYTFTLQTVPSLTSLSIIGSGTPGGWGSDTNLTQDVTNPNVFTGTVVFTDGEAKFRKTGDWGTNFGSSTYPSGWGVGNGSNIPVKAGTYFVRIDIATGEYFFAPTDRGTSYSSVSIIGSGTPGGWGADTNLIQNPANPFKFSKKIVIVAGEAKFRETGNWGVNWGQTTFPNGVGTNNGSNIPVIAGTYQITFNSATGEYIFTK